LIAEADEEDVVDEAEDLTGSPGEGSRTPFPFRVLPVDACISEFIKRVRFNCFDIVLSGEKLVILFVFAVFASCVPSVDDASPPARIETLGYGSDGVSSAVETGVGVATKELGTGGNELVFGAIMIC
jgi:hypothetical protein